MTHECDICGHTVKTRSALWKHKKNKHPETDSDSTGEEATVVSSAPASSGEEETPTPPPTPDEPVWASFTLDFDDEVTDTAPAVLKIAAKEAANPKKAKKKMTKAEAKAFGDLNIALLSSGLRLGDQVMQRYARAVTLQDDYVVKHDESTIKMTAEAQWRYLDSKGIAPSLVINEGIIAGALTAHYFGAPLYRIRKESKVKLIKGRLGFLQRIPVLGRFLGRKKKKKQTDGDINLATEVEQ